MKYEEWFLLFNKEAIDNCFFKLKLGIIISIFTCISIDCIILVGSIVYCIVTSNVNLMLF